nr:hypothetical protein [Tanacetum cinerariifolium]
MSKGDPIPNDQRPKLRTTPPLEAGKLIMDKSPAQRNLENPNSKIAAVREKKDQQNLGIKISVLRVRRRLSRPLPFILLLRSLLMRQRKMSPRMPPEMLARSPKWLIIRGVLLTLVRDNVVFSGGKLLYFSFLHNCFVDGFRLVVLSFLTWKSLLPLHSSRGYGACKEMITHLATHTEEEFLAGLSNVEVVRHAYESLGLCVLSQGELLKRHEQMNHDYMKQRNRDDTYLGEEKESLDQLKDLETERDDCRRTASEHVERIKELEKSLEKKTNNWLMLKSE